VRAQPINENQNEVFARLARTLIVPFPKKNMEKFRAMRIVMIRI